MSSAAHWIATLGLQPHPEGGYYREIYRAADAIPATGLPPRYGVPRRVATAIHFLLKARQVSRLHRLKSDELWFFHAGQPLTVHVIDPAGGLTETVLGGAGLQTVVPAGCWFGASVAAKRGFSLVSCVVAPGFEFADFELADRAALLRQFPQDRRLITRLTRPAGGR